MVVMTLGVVQVDIGSRGGRRINSGSDRGCALRTVASWEVALCCTVSMTFEDSKKMTAVTINPRYGRGDDAQWITQAG